jgi:hypothetical protein
MSATASALPRRSRAVDPAARAHRWAKDGRSREAALYRAVVKRLAAHVGGSPNHAQALIIGRIAWLQVHLARMDERAILDGGLSEHATREYLAWSNTVSRMLDRLGLVAATPAIDPMQALNAHFARRAAEEARNRPVRRVRTRRKPAAEPAEAEEPAEP